MRPKVAGQYADQDRREERPEQVEEQARPFCTAAYARGKNSLTGRRDVLRRENLANSGIVERFSSHFMLVALQFAADVCVY